MQALAVFQATYVQHASSRHALLGEQCTACTADSSMYGRAAEDSSAIHSGVILNLSTRDNIADNSVTPLQPSAVQTCSEGTQAGTIMFGM
jgi:hypothetical protein